MKKQYKKPSAEVVNLKLLGSILDKPNPQPGGWSKWTNDGDAKENSDIVFDDSFGDTWSDQDAGSNAFDLWGE
jgi:hypothetical protein